MRPLWKDMLTAFFLGTVLPGLLVNAAVLHRQEREAPPVQTESTEPEWTVRLKMPSGTVTELEGEAYVARVVLTEMPASFEPEALKAQSVAARTYAQKARSTGGKHGDGSLCTEAVCCQGYMTEEAYLEKGGLPEHADKVRDAVLATAGWVLTYEGELIEAAYFSSSGGATEDAAAVWGTDYPYLKSVESPGETGSGAYVQTLEFTPEEFAGALGRELTGDPRDWVTVTTLTEGGGVAEMTICGQSYSGVALRSLLGLRSTAFALTATGEKIAVTTRGYGHRVGMSQYGAQAMAAEGRLWQEILEHYYPGTSPVNMTEDAPA